MTKTLGLGPLPESWDTERCRWVLSRQRRAPRLGDGVVTAFRDGTVTLRTNRRTDGFTEAVHEIGYQGVRQGDLVVHSMDGFAGAIGISDSDGKASPVVHAYQVSGRADPRYIAYALRVMASSNYIAALAKGIRERSTSFDAATLADIEIPLPPVEEQRRIADFLDAETAKIDSLTNARLRQVRVLRERHARHREDLVGLTPQCARLSLMYLTDPYRPIVYGIVQAGPHDPNGVPYVKTGDLPRLDPERLAKTSQEIHRQFIRAKIVPGDIVMAMRASIGTIAIVPKSLPEANLTQGTARIAPGRDVCVEWLFEALQAESIRSQLVKRAVGSTFLTLNIWDLRRVEMPYLPLREQLTRVQDLMALAKPLTEMSHLFEKQIEILKERRQALIAAAVTGQFDVATSRGAELS